MRSSTKKRGLQSNSDKGGDDDDGGDDERCACKRHFYVNKHNFKIRLWNCLFRVVETGANDTRLKLEFHHMCAM